MRRHSVGTMLVQSLVQGGEFEAALELLEDPTCDTGGAQMIVHLAHEPAHQRRAFLAARERWRNRRSNPFPCDEFLRLFSLHWRKLEPGEREIWLDEILEALDNDPDQPANAGFGERVQFHSMRDSQLFEILNVMHALKPPGEVAAILRAHPNVEDAAKIYPLGLESLISDRPPVPAGGGGGHGGRGYIGSGSRDRGLLAGMRAAHQGDPSAVPQLLAEARRLHREDLDPDDPNLAPHVFWPSCHAYKLAMYWAGRSLGMDAEPELARIPDTDFAILAAIELAAGALALPEPFGVRMEHHPHRHP
jgi:hypothetical protein